MNRLLVLAATTAALSVVLGFATTNPVWVAVMASAGAVYGSIAPVIAARRLYFLAGAAPHAAFLVAVTGIALGNAVGVDPYAISILLGLVLVYAIGFYIHLGADPDIATSVFVSFTASTTVIAVYFVLTNYPVQTDIATIVVGDPLLASSREALVAVLLAASAVLVTGTTYCEQVCIGVDPDTARLSGTRIWVYDLALFTLLALATVALIRIVGFVLEHVLILLPASIAVTGAWSARSAYALSLSASVSASMLGLYASLYTGQAPAGLAGLILLSLYLAIMLVRRAKG